MVMPAADQALRSITGVTEILHCGICDRVLNQGEFFEQKGIIYCGRCRVKVHVAKEYGYGTWSAWWRANKDSFEVKD